MSTYHDDFNKYKGKQLSENNKTLVFKKMEYTKINLSKKSNFQNSHNWVFEFNILHKKNVFTEIRYYQTQFLHLS